MSGGDDVSFNLFGKEGFINPTPWGPVEENKARFDIPFYDSSTGEFRQKQPRDFDGGWRWFNPSYEADALVIYNVKLDRRAHWALTATDMEDSVLPPEQLLYWVKSMVLVEHRYYTAKSWLEDHLRAVVRTTQIQIQKEIYGDDSPHLHSVRE